MAIASSAICGMRGRNREVDDDVDLRVREQVIDREGADAELAGPVLGAFDHDVGDADHIHVVEHGRQVLEIDFRDVAGANDADIDLARCRTRHDYDRPSVAWAHGIPNTLHRAI